MLLDWLPAVLDQDTSYQITPPPAAIHIYNRNADEDNDEDEDKGKYEDEDEDKGKYEDEDDYKVKDQVKSYRITLPLLPNIYTIVLLMKISM